MSQWPPPGPPGAPQQPPQRPQYPPQQPPSPPASYPPQPAQQQNPQHVPPPVPAQPAAYRCPYCGTISAGTTTSCPACGAPLNIRERITDSGWVELPAVRDMSRIQFGNSTCQIAGKYVPAVDMKLAADGGVYFPHHVLLYRDEAVTMGVLPLKGGFRRLLAGMPIIMSTATGPGHIAFSRDEPGEVIAVPIHPGQVIHAREHAMLVADYEVAYDFVQTYIWYVTGSGNDRETHYPIGQFMDALGARGQRPGLMIAHASGNAFMRVLQPGETLLVQPSAFIFKDASVRMNLYIEVPRTQFVSSWRAWSNRYLWLALHGPGRVAVESAFAPLEENAGFITQHS